MRFAVIFEAKVGSAFSLNSSEVGIGELDYIREQLGVDLPIDRVDYLIHSCFCDPEVDLSENLASEIGFEDYNTLHIVVPKGALNWAICTKVDCKRDPNTDEIINAWSYYAVDTDYLIESWLEAGCPFEPEFDFDGFKKTGHIFPLGGQE